MTFNIEAILEQATRELTQEAFERDPNAHVKYINEMTNIELLELIARS